VATSPWVWAPYLTLLVADLQLMIRLTAKSEVPESDIVTMHTQLGLMLVPSDRVVPGES